MLYRNMLVNPGFRQAIPFVNPEDSPREKMGVYYPDATYCRREIFESSNNPATIFSLCVADQKARPAQ